MANAKAQFPCDEYELQPETHVPFARIGAELKGLCPFNNPSSRAPLIDDLKPVQYLPGMV
jgi:hypothetical protein